MELNYFRLNILKPNWFSDTDASAFANAEASFDIEIRKSLRVEYRLALSIFIIFFLGFETILLQAQDISLELANKFFEAEDYENAITEYKRFIFFNPGHDFVPEAYYQIGICYRNQKKWSEAIDSIQRSISMTADPVPREDRKIAIAIIQIARGNYDTAEFDLLRIARFSDNPTDKKKAYFFLGVCYTYRFKWEEAGQAFNRFFSDSLSSIKTEIDTLCQFASNLNYKSPKLAKWLSTIIPGAGQLYVGDIRNGINAFILNSITIYFFINALVEHRLQDALIGNLFLFERYYRGNRTNAERIAQEHNEKIDSDYGKKIIDYLQQIEFPQQN